MRAFVNVMKLIHVHAFLVRTKLAMIPYLDRSRSVMIYLLDRSWLGLGVKIYTIDLNIDQQNIHNLALLLYSNRNRSCFGHPLCDLSQDRQLSGLRPLSLSILASGLTWDVHTKIYSLIMQLLHGSIVNPCQFHC